VALAVFKTDVTEQLGQAGSIPVRLRQQPFLTTRGAAAGSGTARANGSSQLEPLVRLHLQAILTEHHYR
jgi:hypothetical protein